MALSDCSVFMMPVMSIMRVKQNPSAAIAMMFRIQCRFNSVLLRTGRDSIDILEIRRMTLENQTVNRI